MNSAIDPVSENKSILVIDTISMTIELVVNALRDRATVVFVASQANSAEAVVEALRRREWDLILWDADLPLLQPQAVIDVVRRWQPDTPLIIVASAITVPATVDWMRLGARGVVEKSDSQRLVALIKEELEASVHPPVADSPQGSAEKALHTSAEMFRLFIDSAPVATIISNSEGTILLANKAAEDLFGYPRADLIGKPVEVLVPLGFRRLHVEHRHTYARTREHRGAMAVDLSGQRRDSSVFPADIQVSQIDTPDGTVIMSHIIDATQRKQAETTLKQALAQEQELGELKSRLVSMASHEFRNPLAAILTAAETLKLYRDRMSSAQLDERLVRICAQVAHMQEITEDVLQLSRMQSGRARFDPAPGDVDTLCREIAEEFESQQEYRGRIRYACSAPPVKAYFDGRLLRQVISNLVHNALKYSASDQAVTVTLDQDDRRFTLRVKDQGIGIPPNDLKHLFEPFHRAENVGVIAGTGLGLSIVREAIELHGGAITPHTQVGLGTVFTVSIPNLPATDVPAPSAT